MRTAFLLAALALLLAGCVEPDWDYTLPNESNGTPLAGLLDNASKLVAEPPAPPVLTAPALEQYDGGVFTMRKPAGWAVQKAGDCATFSVVASDPANPAARVFYFGELGPMYSNEGQRGVDESYMAMGGYPIQWSDAPVLSPITPQKFLSVYPELTRMQLAKQAGIDWPEIGNAQVISSQSGQALVPGASAETMRALFTAGNSLGEGLFYVSVMELIPSMGSPSSGIAYAFGFSGITASQEKFLAMEPALAQSLASITLNDAYVSQCLQQQQQQAQASRRLSETLSETSDIITDSWEARQKSDDIISEKRSDAMLGRERVYDPDTGDVYYVDNGFYESYDTSREKFQMDRLQPLPADDYALWNAPAFDGSQHIH
jgi:hypothetical protein